MDAALSGAASAMPLDATVVRCRQQICNARYGVRGSAAVGFARLGVHHAPTSHRHHHLIEAGMGRVAALPCPSREGLRGGGSGRGGELRAGVGDRGHGGRRLGRGWGGGEPWR
jgi:hypothetical protein